MELCHIRELGDIVVLEDSGMIKKRCMLILRTVLIVVVLMVIPYIVEKVILGIYGDSFSIRIMFPKEVWFGFISSYLGAIGTVVLGIIAIWQNKRYKELSDRSSEEVLHIQHELKELNKRTVDAIETLEKIEVAIYRPAIQQTSFSIFGVGKELLEGHDVSAYQRNYINLPVSDFSMPLNKLMDKYSTYGFGVCNIGEKAIRNFICHELKINDTTLNTVVNHETDIMSGERAYILFVNLPLITGTNYLELDFEFCNLLLEKYVFHASVLIMYNEYPFNHDDITFEEPHRVI
jgi:hypothetical protein